jgi:hypothetical protein
MTLKEVVYHTFEDPTFSDSALLLSLVINVLIFLSCLCFVAETIPAWENYSIWWYGETVFVAFFSAELALRFWSFPGTTLEFVAEPLNCIDLISVVPFYILTFTSWTLQDTRILRIVRLVRIFKIGRYYTPLMLILETFVRSFGALFLCFFFIAAGVVFFSTMLWYLERGMWNDERECYVRQACTSADRGVWNDERECFVFTDPVCSPFQSIPTAFWWAVATMTTVGYGDAYPVTAKGRVVAGFAMIAGIVCVALPTTILAVEFADKYAKMMTERQQAEELRGTQLLGEEELAIYEDFKRIAAIQKRLDELVPRVGFLVSSHAGGVGLIEDVGRSDVSSETDQNVRDAYEVATKVGARSQRSLQEYREAVYHFIPTFCPMT